VKKSIIHEQPSFAADLCRLYMLHPDPEARIQALKAIANFAVDFKAYLTEPGLVDQLLTEISKPADTELQATLIKCAAFTLKNLSFGCGTKHQKVFDRAIPLSLSAKLMKASLKESDSVRPHLLE
jgi:hypothetical protein